MIELSGEAITRLRAERNLWIATVRPDGRPHLTPVWYVWTGGKFYICIQSSSVKAANLRETADVALSLEAGGHPVICEGLAVPVLSDWPRNVCEIFQTKYAWQILDDSEYDLLIEIEPRKWLIW